MDGKEVLYLELIKAMYGCLKSARLFWEHLSSFLGKLGFTQNRYDLCVANRTINGDVCIVTWHVDDLMISHKKENVVRDIIKELEKEYGNMSVTTGNTHMYCGMDLIFLKDEVEIDMRNGLRSSWFHRVGYCSRVVNVHVCPKLQTAILLIVR